MKASLPNTTDEKTSVLAFISQLEHHIRESSKIDNELQIYQEGINYLTNPTILFDTKVRILFLFLQLFPYHPQLYYFMGWIHQIKHQENAPTTTDQENRDETVPAISLYWYGEALKHFSLFRNHQKQIHPYEIENWLDLFKCLFESNCTKKIQEYLDSYKSTIDDYVKNKDVRMIHFLGAFYIKTNQLKKANAMYQTILDPSFPKDQETEFQIQNNSLVLYSRMANFESLHDLLKRNLSICQSMGALPNVNERTKRNLFCSNMLQYDYIYHDPEDRRQLCSSLVEKYYPVEPYKLSKLPPPLAKSNRISIGYVSADFLHHAVSNFILPILESHDASNFCVVLFVCRHYSKFATDPQFAAIRKKCQLVNLENVGTDDAVRIIRDQYHIDVLFDLHGYTEKNRLDVFAKNPAPVQVTYLGFPNTVGSKNIVKYRITDSVADPVTSRQWWAEELVRLNGGFLLYKSIAQNTLIPFTKPYHPWIVFGSLNRESKNTPEVLECWREILEGTTHTKLLIKLSTTEDDQIHIENYLRKLGCDTEAKRNRIIFAKYGTNEDYFTLFGHIDILLDCFPYSGTTTTCNALYNSVPVITLRHPDLHSHNVSSSLLHHIGLGELIAETPEEYVEKAIELSKDGARLHEYRDRRAIHQKFQQWMNPERFMKEYEGAIMDIWKRERSERT